MVVPTVEIVKDKIQLSQVQANGRLEQESSFSYHNVILDHLSRHRFETKQESISTLSERAR
jgi:hypothetical protein